MVAFEPRQRRKAAAGILMLAVVAAPCGVIAQSAFEPRANDPEQRRIVAKIQRIQAQDGPFSADLIDAWMALSLSYQEHGSHDLAVGAIEKARQVVRINYGLHSMQEGRLMWQEVRNEKAAGDAEGAWHLEEKLLALIKRHPHDLTIAPILRWVGDERMDILEGYRIGQAPPQIVLGCYYGKGLGLPRNAPYRLCTSGSRGGAIRALLTEARSYYRQAIGVMYRHRRYTSELRDLEARLIRASYSSGDYIAGRQSYRRLMTYDAANSVSPLARAATRVEMADWELLFSQHSGTRALDRVMDAYQQAYDSVAGKSIPQASIDAIFSPKMPAVLPAFLPNPLVSNQTPQSRGYVDVAFDIGKYGWSKRIEILDSTTRATHADERGVVTLIKGSKFRPRVADGGHIGTSRVVVRYYLNRREQ